LTLNSDLGKTSGMTIEHKCRFGYIQHPETGKYEKQEYNEKLKLIILHNHRQKLAEMDEMKFGRII